MKRTIVTVLLLASALPLLRCMESDEVTVDETEVAVSNQLLGIPLSDGNTVDSVHVYGLRVGDHNFGLVRAGVTSSYYVTDSYGNVTVTADSLALYVELCAGLCATARYVIDAGGPYYVTMTQHDQNLIEIDTNLIPIRAMFGQTRMAVRNALAHVRVGTDSVKSAVLYGVRVGGVAFGTLDTNQTSDTLDVPDSARVSMVFDSVTVIAVMGFGASSWDDTLMFLSVTPFTVPVARYVTNAVAFTASSAATDSLFAHLGMPR
jgi:hypothetical protein